MKRPHDSVDKCVHTSTHTSQSQALTILCATQSFSIRYIFLVLNDAHKPTVGFMINFLAQ